MERSSFERIFISLIIIILSFNYLVPRFRYNALDSVSNIVRRFKTRPDISEKALVAARGIIEFLSQQDPLPEKADLLMVLGSSDLGVAYRAVSLYKTGLTDKILICGGGLIDGVKEAIVFKKILTENGVPEEIILVEFESRHTGENMEFGAGILAQNDIFPQSVILLQTPIFQRRSKSHFYRFFPRSVECFSSAPYIPDLAGVSAEEALRSIVLALREVYRFLTWGPSQANIIGEVEVPAAILEATKTILENFKHSGSDAFEKEPWLDELYKLL